MSMDAKAALATHQAITTAHGLWRSQQQSRVQAHSLLDSAYSAWSTRRAACKELASQRQASMRAFGTKAKAECSSMAEYTKLVAATKQARGDANSEADKKQSGWPRKLRSA